MVNTKHGRFTSVFWRSLGVFLLSVPVAANAVVIDNGVPQGTLGHWSVDVLTGGETTAAFVTAQRFASGDVATPDVVFEYLSFVDPGIDGGGIRLGDLSDAVPDPNDPNIVSSSGSFGGANLNSIDWTASSTIAPGSQVMVTRYTFRTSNGGPIGPLRFLQYLDEDVPPGAGDDVFVPGGTAINGDLSLFTFDNREVFGVRHSGAFGPQFGLQNSVFAGWAGGEFPLMRSRITGAGQSVRVQGVISDDLPLFTHPQLGTVFGPRDITSVLSWDVDPNASSAEIITTLGGEEVALPPVIPLPVSPASTPIRCKRAACPVSVTCNLPAAEGVMCTNQIDLFVRVRDVRSSDKTPVRAPRQIRLAAAIANIPGGQTVDVPVRLTRRGKQIVRTSTRRRVRGVIQIRDSIGTVISATPIRIRLR